MSSATPKAQTDADPESPGSPGSPSAPLGEEAIQTETVSFRENLYQFSTCAIIRDFCFLSFKESELTWSKPSRHHRRKLRIARIIFCFILLYSNIFCQAFLIMQVKRLISAMSVHSVREQYSVYEAAMYGSHTHKTVNGFYRGTSEEYFRPELFHTLDADEKEEVCQIGLSQPYFLFVLLFIWSLICIGEISYSLSLLNTIMRLPVVSSMGDAVKVFVRKNPRKSRKVVKEDVMKDMGRLFAGFNPRSKVRDEDKSKVEKIASEFGLEHEDRKEVALHGRVVVGLTQWMKALIFLCINVPQISTACYLMWLGCRWLLSTNNFSDAMLNSMALEFIFLLKDLIYNSVISDRNKLDLERTVVFCPSTKTTTYSSMYLKTGWAPVAAIWVILYIKVFQQVLPGYRWDVHAVCEEYLASITRV